MFSGCLATMALEPALAANYLSGRSGRMHRGGFAILVDPVTHASNRDFLARGGLLTRCLLMGLLNPGGLARRLASSSGSRLCRPPPWHRANLATLGCRHSWVGPSVTDVCHHVRVAIEGLSKLPDAPALLIVCPDLRYMPDGKAAAAFFLRRPLRDSHGPCHVLQAGTIRGVGGYDAAVSAAVTDVGDNRRMHGPAKSGAVKPGAFRRRGRGGFLTASGAGGILVAMSKGLNKRHYHAQRQRQGPAGTPGRVPGDGAMTQAIWTGREALQLLGEGRHVTRFVGCQAHALVCPVVHQVTDGLAAVSIGQAQLLDAVACIVLDAHGQDYISWYPFLTHVSSVKQVSRLFKDGISTQQ